MVSALRRQDYELKSGMPGVERPPIETAEYVRESIADYGATLIDLPEDSWQSSVCMWYGDHWEALVDLWTEDEGRSDLVLHVRIAESQEGYSFRIHMVYVP
jgi:hypothetical protein